MRKDLSPAIAPPTRAKRTVHKHLYADAVLKAVKNYFQKIPIHRAGNLKISLDDALMSGLAIFQLNEPSLLAFDKHRRKDTQSPKYVRRIHYPPSS